MSKDSECIGSKRPKMSGEHQQQHNEDSYAFANNTVGGNGLQCRQRLNVGQMPFVITTELDIISLTLFSVTLMSRLWGLGRPNSIVFDELHYGKYASLYVRQTFFFDCHPPLGKMLLAAAAYLAGFDGSFRFDRIGSPYTGCLPVWAFRIVPAICGSLLVPTAYHILLEIKASRLAAFGGAMLIMLDNALLTQSRFALMESILLQFSAFGIYCLLKFRQQRMFSSSWFIWIGLMSVSLTCAVCTKYVGFFTVCLAILVVVWDFWKTMEMPSISNLSIIGYFLSIVMALFILPIVLYLLTFYIHLAILYKAGPHDTVMTSAFQASLEGGLASITKGQPLEVVHGSQITLRHTHGRTCWLHSHTHVYPIRYSDGRGSSHQQQVTCYSFKDVNNWWIVKRPNRNDLVVDEPLDKIRHGDVVQLVHGMTSRALNSHDVAAPVTPQNQEVSCYIDYNISMAAQNLWMVEIVNREVANDAWHTIQSQVRFIHVNSTQALKYTGRQLPDWGFHQHEVATDRVINQEDNVWNVEEHRYTKNADQKDRERELGMAEFVPTAPTHLSFWDKFWEIQLKMFMVNQENVQDHLYSSEPYEWPLLTRGIAYWIGADSNAQIHLLGNVAIWYMATASLILYSALVVFYALRRRRMCFDVPVECWELFTNAGLFFLGYIFHYLPYFFVERTLFLHHYLPAFFYKLLLTVTVLEHLNYVLKKLVGPKRLRIFHIFLGIWFLGVIYVFKRFSVLSYGHVQLRAVDIMDLRWKETWDFIVHRP